MWCKAIKNKCYQIWSYPSLHFKQIHIQSYTNSFSIPSKEKPNSLTKFLCWGLANRRTSFLNSISPCPESIDSLFTAISRPFGSFPGNDDTTKYVCLDFEFVTQSLSLWSVIQHIYLPCKHPQIHLGPTYYDQRNYLLQLWLCWKHTAETPLC